MAENKEKVEGPKVDDNVEKQTIKKKPKKYVNTSDETVKLDLSALKEKAEEITKVDLSQKAEEIKVPETKEDSPLLEEIKSEEVEEETVEVKQPIKAPEQPKVDLPENIMKMVDFMKDTGGDVNDYVRLNKDYSDLDNHTLLKEYYKTTKPHLEQDEIDFLMEDQFSYDADVDDERDIRRKKLALKEQVASAKSHLDGQKSTYYEEIKAGSKLTTEQQKAVNFFDRYNKESGETQKIAEAQKSTFLNKTEQVFNDKFKGFEYNVGDKKYRFNVNNAGEVKDTQSDINNFVKKFLNKDNEMSDAAGYHKSLYTAMNPDAVAKHFYDQGKADAMKNSIAKAKNVDMNPRQSHGKIEAGGLKFKVLGQDSSDFKFKIKNNKFKN